MMELVSHAPVWPTIQGRKMNDKDWFKQQFGNLTHYSPYPWQLNLFNRFIEGIIPSNISLPTGVGKTNAIVVWGGWATSKWRV